MTSPGPHVAPSHVPPTAAANGRARVFPTAPSQRPTRPESRFRAVRALRPFFASTAIHEGETIKAVSEYLGHADPRFTLRTYE